MRSYLRLYCVLDCASDSGGKKVADDVSAMRQHCLLFVSVAYLTRILNILAEEFYFRAWMLPKLAKYGRGSWVINGTMFALYHTFQLWLFPALIVGSLIFAFVFYWTRSV